jgi:hypothetical protein
MEATATDSESKWGVHVRFRHPWAVYAFIVAGIPVTMC